AGYGRAPQGVRAGSGSPRTSYRSRLSLLWLGAGHHGRGERGATPFWSFWSLRPRARSWAIAVLRVGIAHRRLDWASSPRYTGLGATGCGRHLVLHLLPHLAGEEELGVALQALGDQPLDDADLLDHRVLQRLLQLDPLQRLVRVRVLQQLQRPNVVNQAEVLQDGDGVAHRPEHLDRHGGQGDLHLDPGPAQVAGGQLEGPV